jgi:hypothetical protein
MGHAVSKVQAHESGVRQDLEVDGDERLGAGGALCHRILHQFLDEAWLLNGARLLLKGEFGEACHEPWVEKIKESSPLGRIGQLSNFVPVHSRLLCGPVIENRISDPTSTVRKEFAFTICISISKCFDFTVCSDGVVKRSDFNVNFSP